MTVHLFHRLNEFVVCCMCDGGSRGIMLREGEGGVCVGFAYVYGAEVACNYKLAKQKV